MTASKGYYSQLDCMGGHSSIHAYPTVHASVHGYIVIINNMGSDVVRAWMYTTVVHSHPPWMRPTVHSTRVTIFMESIIDCRL